MVNIQLNFSEDPKYDLNFLVLTSELLILFYEFYSAFTSLFFRISSQADVKLRQYVTGYVDLMFCSYY